MRGMIAPDETTLILCATCGAVTVASHVILKNWAVAVLVAFSICLIGVAVVGWLQRADSAFLDTLGSPPQSLLRGRNRLDGEPAIRGLSSDVRPNPKNRDKESGRQRRPLHPAISL